MSIHTDDFSPAAPRMVSPAPTSPVRKSWNAPCAPNCSLDEYVGQAKIREQLEIFIGAARKAQRSTGPCPAVRPAGAG